MYGESIKIKARGKVNLTLNITGTRGEMHVLDSVTASVDVYDIVTVKFNPDGRISTEFKVLEREGYDKIPYFDESIFYPENSVTKAIALIRKYKPELGAEVVVEKGIPVRGGLGGSSADAAAVLVAAKEAFPEDFARIDLFGESVHIGSDVPSMCVGGVLHMSGIGERAVPISFEKLHLVIAGKGEGVSSRDAYAMFDQIYQEHKYCPADNAALLSALSIGDHYAISAQLYNALSVPARKLDRDIDQTIRDLLGTGALSVFMTGSGNCCCGLYHDESEARSAANNLRSYGGWVQYAATTKEGNTVLVEE